MGRLKIFFMINALIITALMVGLNYCSFTLSHLQQSKPLDSERLSLSGGLTFQPTSFPADSSLGATLYPIAVIRYGLHDNVDIGLRLGSVQIFDADIKYLISSLFLPKDNPFSISVTGGFSTLPNNGFLTGTGAGSSVVLFSMNSGISLGYEIGDVISPYTGFKFSGIFGNSIFEASYINVILGVALFPKNDLGFIGEVNLAFPSGGFSSKVAIDRGGVGPAFTVGVRYTLPADKEPYLEMSNKYYTYTLTEKNTLFDQKPVKITMRNVQEKDIASLRLVVSDPIRKTAVVDRDLSKDKEWSYTINYEAIKSINEGYLQKASTSINSPLSYAILPFWNYDVKVIYTTKKGVVTEYSLLNTGEKAEFKTGAVWEYEKENETFVVHFFNGAFEPGSCTQFSAHTAEIMDEIYRQLPKMTCFRILVSALTWQCGTEDIPKEERECLFEKTKTLKDYFKSHFGKDLEIYASLSIPVCENRAEPIEPKGKTINYYRIKVQPSIGCEDYIPAFHF